MPKIKKLPTARKILSTSFKQYKSLSKLFTLLSLMAVLVTGAITLLEGGGSSVAGELWFVIMLTIYIWTVDNIKPKYQPSFPRAFYEGSAGFIKLALVIGVWALYSLPFLLGAGLAAQVSNLKFGAYTWEILVANAIFLGLASISVFWLVRSWMAPLYVLETTPIHAIRDAKAFSKGKMGWLTRSVLLVSLIGFLPVLLILLAAQFSPIQNEIVLVATIIINSYITYGFALPLIVIATYEMRDYGTKQSARRTTKK